MLIIGTSPPPSTFVYMNIQGARSKTMKLNNFHIYEKSEQVSRPRDLEIKKFSLITIRRVYRNLSRGGGVHFYPLFRGRDV